MNKNIFKLLLLLLIVFPIIRVDALEKLYVNDKTNYSVVIEDDADTLSQTEKEELIEEMKALTDFGNIVFKSINENNLNSASNYARNYYHENFGNDSGSVFLIDLDTREIEIFSDGENYKIINTGNALTITDNVYTYASSGDYYKCASIAFEQMNSLFNNKRIPEPMRISSYVFISITLGLFITFIIVTTRYKVRLSENFNTLEYCDVDFKVSNVKAVFDGVENIYSPVSSYEGGSSYSSSSSGRSGSDYSSSSSSSSSSDSSSSSGSSYDSSSGGGGGHRF